MRRIHSPSKATVLALLALTVSLSGMGLAFGRGASNQAPTAAAAVHWHALTLQNGWVYAGFGSYHAAYYKDSGGVVHLRGSLSSGTPYPTAAFRLPLAARPVHTLWLTVYALSGASGGLVIYPNGQAKAFDDTGTNSDVIGYTSLDGISFRVP
jgi:hypothetical protein